MTKKNNSFIDTDIIGKIGGYQGEKLLSKILCSFNYNLYIHEYLVDEELIFGENALQQLKDMICENKIQIMRVSELLETELKDYKSVEKLLAEEMCVDLYKKRDRNAGEVKSMALAFVKDFNYFISDDRGARVAAKKHLQNLDGSYLKTIRMRDIIIHIKKNEEVLNISRKSAKRLYLYGTNPKLARNAQEKKKLEMYKEKLKSEFDEVLWVEE